jgi:hypothetical protein
MCHKGQVGECKIFHLKYVPLCHIIVITKYHNNICHIFIVITMFNDLFQSK